MQLQLHAGNSLITQYLAVNAINNYTSKCSKDKCLFNNFIAWTYKNCFIWCGGLKKWNASTLGGLKNEMHLL